MNTTAKLALVGDRSPTVRAHGRIPQLIEALRRRDGIVLDPYWIPTAEAEDLEGFDGIWVVPGSPYEDTDRSSPRSPPPTGSRSRSSAPAAASSTRSSTSRASWPASRTPHHAEYGASDEPT